MCGEGDTTCIYVWIVGQWHWNVVCRMWSLIHPCMYALVKGLVQVLWPLDNHIKYVQRMKDPKMMLYLRPQCAYMTDLSI